MNAHLNTVADMAEMIQISITPKQPDADYCFVSRRRAGQQEKNTGVHWRLRPANFTTDVREYVRDVTTNSRVDFTWVL